MAEIRDRTKIFKKYQSKWVALTDDNRVISVGLTLDDILKKAKRKGFENPIIAKIPDLKHDYVL